MPLRLHVALRNTLRPTIFTLVLLVTTVLLIGGDHLFAESLTVEGFTEPYRRIDVAAAEPGVITALHVREGDVVHPEQLLATLDLDILIATRKMAEASMHAQGSLQVATARLALKQARLARLRELKDDGHANSEEVATAEREVQVAEAELTIAKEDRLIKAHEYARIEAQIERRHIRSPIRGIVTEIHKEIAEYVSTTDPNVITIVQCDRLRAFFAVPAAATAKLSANQNVELVFSDGLPPVGGSIEFVSPVINPESRTVQLKVVFDNARGVYRSGLSCSMLLQPAAQPVAAQGSSKTSR
jgi:RND family efflux transporter MFP subunit